MVYVFCSFCEKNNVYSFKTIHMCAFTVRYFLYYEGGNYIQCKAEKPGKNKISLILFPGFSAILCVVTPSLNPKHSTCKCVHVRSFKGIYTIFPQNKQKTYICNLLKFYNDPTNIKEMAKLQSLKSYKEHS